jgi:hypothetical protein
VLCVADLGCWAALKQTWRNPQSLPAVAWPPAAREGRAEAATTVYVPYALPDPPPAAHVATPLGALLAHRLGRLAQEDSSIRPWASYFSYLRTRPDCPEQTQRLWSGDIYSPTVRKRVLADPRPAD